MKKVVIGIILNAFALFATAQLVDSITYTGGVKTFIIGGLFIGLLNTFVKPFVKVLSIPFIIITGGLLLIVINALILWLAVFLVNSLEFKDVTLNFAGLGTYFFSAIILGVINWGEHLIVKNR